MSPPLHTAAEDSSLSLAERRTRRLNRQLPKRFRDDVPQPLPLLPPEPAIYPLVPASTPLIDSTSSRLRVRQTFTTTRNAFGLWRRYETDTFPSHDPEERVDWQQFVDDPLSYADQEDLEDASMSPSDQKPFGPFPNKSAFLLGDWYWNHGSQKSQDNFRKLVAIIGDKDFRPQDVRLTKWREIDKALGKNPFDESENDDGETEWMDEDAGWRKTPIHISVPFHHRMRNPGPKDYVVGDLYHRSLVSVIKEKLRRPHDNHNFHYHGFETFWKRTGRSRDIRVHGELYTSPAYLEAQREVLESPGEPDCVLPRVVVAMMFWSDVTHLTSFGNAKLWPAYLFFGNDSKYQRCKPSCHLCEHVAYFQTVSFLLSRWQTTLNHAPQLPDSFKDFASQHAGNKAPSKHFMTHCRRELLHAQWSILLDDEFLEAYEHGIVIECLDGIKRRFYPRILTYSADYPEKYAVPFLSTFLS